MMKSNKIKPAINTIIVILLLLTVFACVMEHKTENIYQTQETETIVTSLPDATEIPKEDEKTGTGSVNNDQKAEDDKPDYIPYMNIDDATNALIGFWKENRENLESMAEEMKERGIKRIDVFNNARLSVQYNSNAFSLTLNCSDRMNNVIDQCKGDTVCLTDCEFVWAEFKNLLSSECMCFYYGTRVFKDERYGCFYSLSLVLLGDHFQEIKPGWDAEDLGNGWILIIYELE